ncbi:MAG: hypothetical protein BGO67_04415 [Alphaproteobacteria bacterium 41-28]|nr:MAG: hypothetical protein BGO67_04415 [Alphaproteobacteria bacterium 41-28]
MLEKIKLSGFTLMAISMFLYALTEAIEKYLTKAYEPYHIIFFRSSVGIALVIWITFTKGIQSYKQEIRLNILRNFLAAVALFLTIYSLKNLPLSSYEFMSFMSPVLVALLSAGFLKEKLPPFVFVSILLSIVGAAMMSYPFQNIGINLGLLFAFLSTFFNASAAVATKRLAHLDFYILYATYVLTCFVMSGLFSYGSIHLDLKDAPLFILIAFIHFVAFQFLILAFRKEDLVKLSPLEYTIAVWSVLLGYVFWGYIPASKELFGGLFIILGSIVIRRKELTSFARDGFNKLFRNRTVISKTKPNEKRRKIRGIF